MEDKVYFLAYQLKEMLDKNPKVIALNEIEKKMNDDNEVILLVVKKDKCLEEYNQLSRFLKEDDQTLIEARKKLVAAKEELNNHPLVKEYLSLYKEVRELYQEINHLLFTHMSAKLK